MNTSHALIDQYIHALKSQNEIHNLYSKSAYDRLSYHIHDCQTMAKFISNKKQIVLDIGSGAGLPSIILAIENPLNEVYAVESKNKKCDFLFHVKQILNLKNYHPIRGDINEVIIKHALHPHWITAKAFAPHDKIVKICKRVSRKNNPKLLVPISQSQLDSIIDTPTITHSSSSYNFHYIHHPI